MLYSMNYFRGLPLRCKGEDYGFCEDLYFEDGSWKLRHLVACDGAFVFKRRSLVSPECINRLEFGLEGDVVPLTIGKAALESAPALESEIPFSRSVELAALKHYHLTPYWGTGVVDGGLGMGAGAGAGMPLSDALPEEEWPEKSQSNLRSLNEILDYDVRNDETSLGKVSDLVLDITDFTIVYLAVDTKPGESGGVRLVSTTQEDVGLSIDCASRSFKTQYSSCHLLESPSADLSAGRLSLGDQQKVDISSY